MERWRNRWAVVTGASAGIGRALVELLVAGGARVVAVARRRQRLEELAGQLQKRYTGAVVEVCVADLAAADGPAQVAEFTSRRGLQVDLLVNNAGFGAYGEFLETPLERYREMIQVNVTAVVDLTYRYLPGMVERRRGDILIVASTAAFQPVPYLTCYAATKGFDLLFAEALAEEYRRFGIRVCALCPGPTETEFQAVAGQPGHLFRLAEKPEKVARVGLQALAAGRTYVISGWWNYLQTQAERLAPRGFIARSAAALMAPARVRR
jgi:short-subunit dehydrogenase